MWTMIAFYQLTFLKIKEVILIVVSYLKKNKTSSKRFLKKFHNLTNDLCEIKIKRITKKIRTLFCSKGKNPHPACTICKGVCIYKENYNKTKRHVLIRWEEYSGINKIFEPSTHLKNNLTHAFA